MSTTYVPIGITELSSSRSSAMSSFFSVASNVMKDDAEAGIVTVTVTASPSGSVVAGREYDHGAGSFVLTMV